ncbi:MAG TPA: hypothetical protein VM734_16120 [Kofleriaceae bacterium]|nr:hypothetical protein [Kofleriaceae bacterium]
MTETALAMGTWWSYAEANGTALGIVVGLVALAAVIFVGRRAVEQLRQRRR